MTNREIKFRAWDERKKVMHFNFQWIESGTSGNDWILFTSTQRPIECDDKPLYNPCFSQQLKKMQYTGIKDKNGKEIYEGDILYHHGIVAWNDVEHCWSRIDLTWNDKREWHSLDSLTSPFEVIGNIYEKTGLLK